jgi:undecaprenyl-diphosphatase
MNASKVRAVARRWWPHAAAAVVLGLLMIWDREAFAAIRSFQSHFLNWLTDRISQLRGATFPSVVALLMIVFGVVRRRTAVWRAGIAVLLTVLLVGTLTTALKEIISRPGPLPQSALRARSLFDERFGRFPSSHSAVTIGAATVIAAFLPAAAVPAFLVALLVCYERIYRGTHFPSDIFAGIWIGFVCARFVLAQLARRESWREDFERARNSHRTVGFRAAGWARKPRDAAHREPVV